MGYPWQNEVKRTVPAEYRKRSYKNYIYYVQTGGWDLKLSDLYEKVTFSGNLLQVYNAKERYYAKH